MTDGQPAGRESQRPGSEARETPDRLVEPAAETSGHVLPTDPDVPERTAETVAGAGADPAHGAGQDPSVDVLTPSGGASVSAAAGNPSTDPASATTVPSQTGDDHAAPLAASPARARASAVVAPPGPAHPGTDMFGATFGGDTSGFSGLVKRPPLPLSTPRPYGGWFDEVADALQEAYPQFSDDITRVVVDRGELTLHVRPERVAAVCQVLRDDENLRFELLSSLSGVDYLDQHERLHVAYHLTSMTYRRRIRLEVAVTAEHPHVATVTAVYPTADFQERETWDMFGVIFDGHPGLTRILMPDDWPGHPQRKDYPLGGVPVEYKGAQIPPPDERRSYA